ncbi:MAG: non-ribosomal peptide synthetase [Ktedonobacteraceae bacterium]
MSTPEHLSERISHLSPERLALLEKLKQGEFHQELSDETSVISRRSDQGTAPLSFSQQRLWFFDQLEPNSAAYNMPAVVSLRGKLDVPGLERSLREIAQRHEILRTTFVNQEGHLVQVAEPSAQVSLPVTDLRDVPEEERDAQVQKLVSEEIQRPFDLHQGPLMRVLLLRLAEQEYVLVVTMHHIISDGWSMGVLVRELAALYPAFAQGQQATLPELPLQYADYATWQRERLQGEYLEEQLDFWRELLADAPTILELPTDYRRPAVQTYRGAQQTQQLPETLTEQLKELSRQEGATLFMTLLTAFGVLLARYSGQEDLLIGSPIANRNWHEVEGLIGLFVNTLVLRCNVRGNPSFREALHRVREMVIDGFAHQELPFEKLVEVLQPERDLSRSPLYQVVFILQNVPMPPLDLLDTQLSVLESDNKTSKFDLTLTIMETEQGLLASFEYNTDLFEAATIERMANHYRILLEGIVANADQHITDLPLLSIQERERLLLAWNDTRTDFSGDSSQLLEGRLFEEQVERTPEAEAVICGQERLSYRELNQRSNQLARYLQKQGVGSDVLVGICIERSLDMMVGLLGILKAGGAYVPLDPTYPKHWLSFIVEDTRVPVLLTHQRLVADLPEHRAQVICLDADWSKVAGESTANITSTVNGDNLSYVAYTSGSTGKPKGVMNTRRGHVNYLLWAAKAYGAEAGNGSLVHSSFAFDFTNTTLFPPLLVGRSVMLLSEASAIEALVPALKSCADLSLIKITPVHLALLNQLLSSEEFSGRTSTLVVGADQLLPEAIEPWQKFAPDTRLFNEYGPTETVDGCSAYQITPDSNFNMVGSVPIGRPIANTQFYVLDATMQPVPVGVPGELYIGGAGVARGYLNRPELTAEKFVPHPFSEVPGARLYRTGDVVRYLPDGNAEFLGRVDHQVKIRGYRVEPGETESVLGQHHNVREVFVMVREDTPGDKRLVAYLVPEDQEAFDVSELRSFVKEYLPDYMVPSYFITLDTLPLSQNGKVDRNALPAPEGDRPDVGVTYIPPQTSLERNLVSIWQEVLHLDKVGTQDNFFDLGGHSLLLVEIQSKLRDVLQQEITLVDLFQYPTISTLAKYLSQQQGSGSSSQRARDRAETRKASMSRLEQRRRAVQQKGEI